MRVLLALSIAYLRACMDWPRFSRKRKSECARRRRFYVGLALIAVVHVSTTKPIVDGGACAGFAKSQLRRLVEQVTFDSIALFAEVVSVSLLLRDLLSAEVLELWRAQCLPGDRYLTGISNNATREEC